MFIFISEVLPLVEFKLENGISDEEALKLLETPGPSLEHAGMWSQRLEENFQSMRLDEAATNMPDPFTARLVSFEVSY